MPDPGVDVTTDVIARLTAAVSDDCTVEGSFEEFSDLAKVAWTFTVSVPDPTEDNPDQRQGIGRQIVTDGGDPTAEQIDGLVSEVAATASTIQQQGAAQ
jgi:hypothetical protein